MPIKDKIKHIINSHKNPDHQCHNINHWLNKYGDHIEFPESSHIGEYYRQHGMKIDPQAPNDPKAIALKEIMDDIKRNIKADDHFKELAEEEIEHSQKLNEESDDETYEAEKIRSLGNGKKKKRMFILGKWLELSDHSRSLHSVDLLEEYCIKAVAVSILAETNGNSKIARKILNEAGGMKIIKSLDVESLRELLTDLQDILADPAIEKTIEDRQFTKE
ncbi:MAG: hypothetical protein O3B09_02065 [Proteobacteria bacterium]|nr:hypothetical protein [Pseudomonadota bacterium]